MSLCNMHKPKPCTVVLVQSQCVRQAVQRTKGVVSYIHDLLQLSFRQFDGRDPRPYNQHGTRHNTEDFPDGGV